MKSLALLLCVLGNSLLAAAQQQQVIYYENGKKAIEGSWQYTSAKTLGTAYLDPGYLARGARQDEPHIQERTGNVSDWNAWQSFPLNLIYDGPITAWYPSGEKKVEFVFRDGAPNGPYTVFHANGKPAMRGTLKDGMPQGQWTVWYASGSRYYTGSFEPYSQAELQQYYQLRFGEMLKPNAQPPLQAEESLYGQNTDEAIATAYLRQVFQLFSPLVGAKKHGDFRFFYEDGRPWGAVSYANNLRMGTWTLWQNTDSPVLKLEYRLGELLTIIDSTGTYSLADYTARWRLKRDEHSQGGLFEPSPPHVNEQNVVYSQVDKAAIPPNSMQKYFNDNLRYPELAKKAGVEGRVILSFTVEADGSTSEPQIQRRLGYGCDEEAKRLVLSLPRWKPAEIKGVPARSVATTTVFFTLKKSGG